MDSTAALAGLHQRGRQGTSQTKNENSHEQETSSLISSARNVNKKASSWKWWLMTVAALVVAGWAFVFVFIEPPGGEGYPEIRARILANWLGIAHVGGGGIAMLLGPFQFLTSLRRTGRPSQGSPRFSAHSIVGRIYAISVLSSAIGSLDIVKKSDLYTFGAAGFLSLGAGWFVTASLGWAAMWKATPDIDAHKRWMTRNFTLTYAAVMLRWQLPLMTMGFGMELKYALSWTGWISWVPTLLLVESYISKSKQRVSASGR